MEGRSLTVRLADYYGQGVWALCACDTTFDGMGMGRDIVHVQCASEGSGDVLIAKHTPHFQPSLQTWSGLTSAIRVLEVWEFAISIMEFAGFADVFSLG